MAIQNTFNVKTLIKVNNKGEPNNIKHGIYSITRQNCNMVYIGRTKRNIYIRLREHLRNIRVNQDDKSALVTCVLDKGHGIQNETKILKQKTNPKN